MRNIEDCEKCGLKECPEKCFNNHPGSMIALKKLVNKSEIETGKKILVLDEHGREVK
jgi:hypothetical protein